MGKKTLAALACVFCACAYAGPFDQFKGKMKPGMYEMTMDMDMPGMPAGMGKQSHKMQNCLTAEDIDKGSVGRKDKPDNCEVKNFKMSGNTATYTTVCKGEREMTADTSITFSDAGYKMDTKMAMKNHGQPMNMTQHLEGRYVGPCTK